MDSKIRISFFPANASKVRVFVFSRRFGLLFLGVAGILSVLGFWLIVSGTLHESKNHKAERLRLKADNTALKERVEGLESDAQEVEKGLKHLENVRDEALLATGLESATPGNERTSGGIWTFFHRFQAHNADPGAALATARSISLFYDSTLVVLRNAQEQSESFPTGLPVPRSALLTRGFGLSPDPFTGKKSLHPGLDFSDRPGTSIYAAGAGTVVAITQDPIWGLCVRIRHRPGMESLYAHLTSTQVRQNQRVVRGEILGQMGESGQSTGPHLHYELRLQGERVNPLQFLLPSERGGV